MNNVGYFYVVFFCGGVGMFDVLWIVVIVFVLGLIK